MQELNGVVEIAVSGGKPKTDPYLDAVPRVEFTSPAGRVFLSQAFRDGDAGWKVRFSPDETGRWTWALQSAAQGAVPAGGSFEVAPSSGRSPWRRHGHLRVHPSNRAFAHADGTPVFWLADTVWAAPAHATPEEWRSYLARRGAQGFNVVQINALPQWDASGPPLREPFLRTDGKEDYRRIDPAYFRTLDAMVAAAADAGMIPAIVVLWFDNTPDDNPDWAGHVPLRGPATDQTARALARYLVARYEAYGATWFVSGDTGFASPGAVALYDAAAEAIVAASSRPPLITAHLNGGTAPSADLGRRSWLGYITYQSCHFRDSADRARRYSQAGRALMPPRPVMNSEPCYDSLRIMDADNSGDERFDRDAVRRASWASILSGASAGVTYGAHGLWPWHREGQAYGPMHYGLPPDWRAALMLESSDDLVRLRRCMETLPWWKIEPATGVRSDPPEAMLGAASAGSDTWIIYLTGHAAVTVTGQFAQGASAEWVDPVAGKSVTATLTHGANGVTITASPARNDQVLLVRRVVKEGHPAAAPDPARRDLS